MKYICLMGRSSSGRKTIERVLEGLGFKKNVSYTTREPKVRNGIAEEYGKDYYFVNNKQFSELVHTGIIIDIDLYKGSFYGTARPFGATHYVSITRLSGFKALKGLYGKQVIGIYLDCSEARSIERERAILGDTELSKDDVQQKMKEAADFVLDTNGSTDDAVATIIKYINEREGTMK